VHKPFVVLEFIIKLLLDVVFHFMRDKSACNLFAYLGHDGEVVGCEVLVALLVCDFEAADGMIAKLNRNEEDVSDHLMQSIVDAEVIAKLLAHILALRFTEMFCLPRVEDAADYVVGLALEGDRFAQTACDDFAE